MHKTSGLLAIACLLIATPAFAGDLSFDEKGSSWKPLHCAKPLPPQTADVTAETAGDAMNAIIARYNNYVDAAQEYMDCVSTEAAEDQKNLYGAIVSGAQAKIDEVQAEATKALEPLRRRQKR